MNRALFLAAAVLLAGTHAPALAQAKATAAAPTKEQQDHAIQDFAIMASAMRSDKVGDDVKSALMGCLYTNTLEKISTAVDKVIADNPGKIDRTKPDSLLSVMAAVCGYRPQKPAAAPAAPSAGSKGR